MHLLLQNFATLGVAEKSLSLVPVEDHLILNCGGGSFDNSFKAQFRQGTKAVETEIFFIGQL